MTPAPPPAPAAVSGADQPPPPDETAGSGAPEPAGPPPMPTRRNSPFPLLLDFGLVLILFGLVIIGPLFNALAGQIVLGVGVALGVLALIGWAREARADYARLPE